MPPLAHFHIAGNDSMATSGGESVNPRYVISPPIVFIARFWSVISREFKGYAFGRKAESSLLSQSEEHLRDSGWNMLVKGDLY
jgi:hypothetical protein